MATLDEKDIESVGAGEDSLYVLSDSDNLDSFKAVMDAGGRRATKRAESEARAKAKEDNKIEVQGGSALNKFFNLDENQQAALLEQIGLEKKPEPTAKELFKKEPKSFQDEFKRRTNTQEIGLIKSAGKAFENLSNKLESSIGEVMSNPNKRALFYAGLDMIDKSSGYGPLSEAKSPIGIIGGGLKRGTEKVKAEELSAANAASRSQSSNLANQLKLMEFQFKMDEPGAGEIALTKSLDKKIDGLMSSVDVAPLYGGMKKQVADRLKAGDKTLPVGVIREKIPTTLQAINDLLPQGAKQGNAFFEKIQSDAAFIGKFKKLHTDVVLSKISNTKLVPVSDRDVQLVGQSITTTANTPQVFLATLRSGDAMNYLNAKKVEYGDVFKSERGYKRGSKRNFDQEFLTQGAALIRNEIFDEYGEEAIREEARKLGFAQDYNKYSDEQKDYSPYALAEAKASIDMGGLDNYITMQSGIDTGKETTVAPGTNTPVSTTDWKKKYPSIGGTQPE
jgi:hypothetical protein